jgi:hypothetical protein
MSSGRFSAILHREESSGDFHGFNTASSLTLEGEAQPYMIFLLHVFRVSASSLRLASI